MPAEGEVLLKARDLTVCYRTGEGRDFAAVVDASFEILPGEVVGMLGESGCGKTTVGLALLRLFSASGRITRGSVLFRGQDLLRLDETSLQQIRGAEISMVFQEPALALNPVLCVGEQIAEVLRAHRPWDRRRCSQEAMKLLDLVRLPEPRRISTAYPYQLSGGQRQRVVIAQAIACRPALVIADEPTTALDATLQAEILALLRELKDSLRIAFLIITHNPAALMGLADRVMVMYAGRIIEEGSAAQIFSDPLHPYAQGLMRSLPRARGPVRDVGRYSPTAPGQPSSGVAGAMAHGGKKPLPTIGGSPPDPAQLLPGCPFEPRCPDRMEICRTREPQEIELKPSRRVRCFKYGG